MSMTWTPAALRILFAAMVASAMLVWSSAARPNAEQTAAPATPIRATAVRPGSSPYRAVAVPNRARNYYLSVWGIDNLLVRKTASGNLIRFSYRVNDPARATLLGDNRATPYMFGQRSQAVLQIPVMDKIGQLRQTGIPVAGKEYWMVFSNKGQPVKVGDRVNVVIGSFHADGLMVE